jgi:hypothetical protein
MPRCGKASSPSCFAVAKHRNRKASRGSFAGSSKQPGQETTLKRIHSSFFSEVVEGALM